MSTPRVGSSASTTRGAQSIIRAKSTFCWFPPERPATGAEYAGPRPPQPPSTRPATLAAPQPRPREPPLRASAHDAEAADRVETRERHVLDRGAAEDEAVLL